MMRKLQLPFALFLLTLISACQTLGVPTPQTFNQRAAAVTASLNAASQTTLTLLQAQKISPNESDSYVNRIEGAQEAVNSAVHIHGYDAQGAEDNLAAAIRALEIITAELEARK